MRVLSVQIEIKLVPRSSRVGFLGMYNGKYKIGVSSPPVDNQANEALIEFLAKAFHVAKKKVNIESGHASRDKRVSIEGVEDVPESWKRK